MRFLLMWLLSGMAWAEAPRPLTGNPGNVFIEGQEVVVTLGGEASGWECFDYEGKSVGSGKGGDAKLGKLGAGYYEIWKLGEDGSRKSRTTLGVLAPLKVPVPDDTPIAIDTAAAWFFRDEAKTFGLKEAANLSALAGVKWTRDRLRWSEMEPEKGKFSGETIYDWSAAAFAGEGLKVLQVFHDTPKWAGKKPKFFPDDLRDVHGFLETMSRRWKGKVHAWEPWNEGDTTNFGGHTGTEMMAYQRAAYHGIRAGNPEAIVCQNVFAEHRRTGVLENYIENVDASVFDTFNFHHYVQPDAIPAAYQTMRAADSGRPVWVTESYYHFRQGVKKSDVELTEDQRKLRARFTTVNLVTALNEGPEVFFTFLLPHYVENGVLFGVLNEDGTPRADYVAMAAAGRLLAGARTMGRMAGDLTAYGFHAIPDGEEKMVVVVWGENEARKLPAELSTYEKAYDFLGREFRPTHVGIDPLYLIFPVTGARPEMVKKRELIASPLVVQAVFPPERLRLGSSSWALDPHEEISVPLRCYDFGDRTGKIHLTVDADAALKVMLSDSEFEIAAGDRWEGTMKVGWSGLNIPAKPMLIKVTASAEGHPASVAVFRISAMMGGVTPVESRRVISSDWKPGSSAGELDLKVSDGVMKVNAKLNKGDRWVYPWLDLKAEERPDESYDGVAFDLNPGNGEAAHHVMLREPGGSLYVASLGGVTGKRRVVALFKDFEWAGYSPVDANHRLDLGSVEAISIGGNPKQEDFTYELSGLEWVKFAK